MSKRTALHFLATAVGFFLALCPSAALTALMRPMGAATAATVSTHNGQCDALSLANSTAPAQISPHLFFVGLSEQNVPPAELPGSLNSPAVMASPTDAPGNERPGWMDDWQQVTPGADAPQASLPEDTTPQSSTVTGGAAPADAGAAPPVTHRLPRMGKVAPSHAPPRAESPAAPHGATGDSAKTASPATPHGVAGDAATAGVGAASSDAAPTPA